MQVSLLNGGGGYWNSGASSIDFRGCPCNPLGTMGTTTPSQWTLPIIGVIVVGTLATIAYAVGKK